MVEPTYDFANMTPEEWTALMRAGGPRRKVVSQEVWDEIRRSWEGGETGQSLAQRYDVGLSNLWRRRASEAWERAAPEQRKPEPAEGWEAYEARMRQEFNARIASEREVAVMLLRFLQGDDDLMNAPLWHLGFLFNWRAEHLGPERAAADREAFAQAPWADRVWATDGTLKSERQVDAGLLEFTRKDWRAFVGLPAEPESPPPSTGGEP